MLDLNSIFEFSRNHCVAICAFLVPANLLATSFTILLLFFGKSEQLIPLAKTVAICLALTLFLHIGTWLIVGVVMAPTFILFGLGVTCLLINLTGNRWIHQIRLRLQAQ